MMFCKDPLSGAAPPPGADGESTPAIRPEHAPSHVSAVPGQAGQEGTKERVTLCERRTTVQALERNFASAGCDTDGLSGYIRLCQQLDSSKGPQQPGLKASCARRTADSCLGET